VSKAAVGRAGHASLSPALLLLFVRLIKATRLGRPAVASRRVSLWSEDIDARSARQKVVLGQRAAISNEAEALMLERPTSVLEEETLSATSVTSTALGRLMTASEKPTD
jgi:hypothetical protein